MKRSIIAALVLICASAAHAACPDGTRPTINAQGVAGADVVVNGTAGGVLAADAGPCSAKIYNSGVADMRCAPTGVTPTATVGVLVPAGTELRLGLESRTAWSCIRTTGTSTAANVKELRP